MKIGIFGAGAVGCYLGGRLIAAGYEVNLVGRASLGREINQNGLSVSDLKGFRAHIPLSRVNFSESVVSLKECDIVFVTVKSQDTIAGAAMLRPVLGHGVTVISFQNGVRNVRTLRDNLPNQLILAGIVPFNVVRKAGATFHRASNGPLLIEKKSPESDIAAVAFRSAGVQVKIHRSISKAQWGKLLVNLGNGLNALAGLPLPQQIADIKFRRLIAGTISEAAAILQKSKVAYTLPLPARVLSAVLMLPDSIFNILSVLAMSVGSEAKSSMLDDLERRRMTEVEYLNGEIVALARQNGLAAPFNEAILRLVHDAEKRQVGSPCLRADELIQLFTST